LESELLGNSVSNLLKRQRAFSVSPFERRTSHSRKRRVSSGWDWGKTGLCAKSKTKRQRIRFHKIFDCRFRIADFKK
jgi:hypothetical protein